MKRKDCILYSFHSRSACEIQTLFGHTDIFRGLDDVHTVDITLSHSRTVVTPAVVRKKELKNCAKVDTNMVPTRLGKTFIWREGITKGE